MSKYSNTIGSIYNGHPLAVSVAALILFGRFPRLTDPKTVSEAFFAIDETQHLAALQVIADSKSVRRGIDLVTERIGGPEELQAKLNAGKEGEITNIYANIVVNTTLAVLGELNGAVGIANQADKMVDTACEHGFNRIKNKIKDVLVAEEFVGALTSNDNEAPHDTKSAVIDLLGKVFGKGNVEVVDLNKAAGN